MKLQISIGIGVLLFGLCGVLAAAPAPWFKWRSKVDGRQFCVQTSLGHGWEKASGPYQDSHCEKLIAVK
jgi:hypothetical protein